MITEFYNGYKPDFLIKTYPYHMQQSKTLAVA